MLDHAKIVRPIAALLAALAVSGCGEVVPQPRSAAPPPRFTPATPRPSQDLVPEANTVPVIGADARGLVRLFGEPRLDIRDPAARKLQFGNGRCVLDTYLYVPRGKREPVVTYAEARSSDGREMAWNACAEQLRAR